MAYKQPDKNGFYGRFGGRFVPETLMTAVLELEKAYRESQADPSFQAELDQLLKQYVGRETPLYYAKNLTKYVGGARSFLKEKTQPHRAHKINNALGQVLLAHRMGKRRSSQKQGPDSTVLQLRHFAAVLGLECDVYMGEEDTKRQALNVFRMNLLGATVHPITSGTGTLKDATNEAMRAWTANAEDTFYVLGSAVGPHPYPLIVKHFQSVISKETRKQLLENGR